MLLRPFHRRHVRLQPAHTTPTLLKRRWYSAQSRAARFQGELARVVVLTDITDLKLREESALHDAHHDKLTGLANRAVFERRLEVELVRRDPGHVPGCSIAT